MVQKTIEPHPFAEVEGCRGHNQVDLIPCQAFEKIAPEAMVFFQMPDDRFYARSFAEEFSQLGPFIGGGVGRSFSWQKNLRFTNSLTSSIASVIETKCAFTLSNFRGNINNKILINSHL